MNNTVTMTHYEQQSTCQQTDVSHLKTTSGALKRKQDSTWNNVLSQQFGLKQSSGCGVVPVGAA